MAWQSGTRRVLLLFSVLAGLFLMHGLTGGGPGGDSCHGVPPAPMAMSSAHGVPARTTATRPVPSVPRVTATPVTASGPDPAPGHPQAGQTCVPLRPEGLSGLFPALFPVVMTAWRPRLPFGVRLIRAHWPHGPPRTGVQVLRVLSVSRT